MSQGRPKALGRLLGEAPWGGISPGLQIIRKNACQMHVSTPLAYKLYVNNNKLSQAIEESGSTANSDKIPSPS